MVLRHQNLASGAVPATRPVFVCPADAEGERARPTTHEVVERALKNALPFEPVVVVAEAVNAIPPRKLELSVGRFGEAQVVVAQARRAARLKMAVEERLAPANVGPFREPFPPPLVVFRRGVKLR